MKLRHSLFVSDTQVQEAEKVHGGRVGSGRGRGGRARGSRPLGKSSDRVVRRRARPTSVYTLVRVPPVYLELLWRGTYFKDVDKTCPNTFSSLFI
jgi:hypothetical protein